MLKKLGIGLKKQALKLSGTKIAEDEAFEAKLTTFTQDHRRTQSLRKSCDRASRDLRNLASAFRKAGASVVAVLTELSAGKHTLEEAGGISNCNANGYGLDAWFVSMGQSLEEMSELYHTTTTNVQERLRVFPSVSNGPIHLRMSRKLALDKARGNVMKLEGRPTPDELKIVAGRDLVETREGEFTQADAECERVMEEVMADRPAFIAGVSKELLAQSKDFFEHLGAVSASAAGSIDKAAIDLCSSVPESTLSMSDYPAPVPLGKGLMASSSRSGSLGRNIAEAPPEHYDSPMPSASGHVSPSHSRTSGPVGPVHSRPTGGPVGPAHSRSTGGPTGAAPPVPKSRPVRFEPPQPPSEESHPVLYVTESMSMIPEPFGGIEDSQPLMEDPGGSTPSKRPGSKNWDDGYGQPQPPRSKWD